MTFWILSAVAIPLCVLLLVPSRATRPLLWPVLPLLPLPALGLALMGPGNWQLELPGLLLGASWQLDELRQPFLLLTALLWSFAGLFASGYITTRRTSFALYWGLTALSAIDQRHLQSFRYYMTGSPFEYTLVRKLSQVRRQFLVDN